MKNWEYVLLNSLGDLLWCEGLYAYYDDGIKKIYDDDDDEPDFPNNGLLISKFSMGCIVFSK